MKLSNKLLVGLLALILAGITIMMIVVKVYTKEFALTEQEAPITEEPVAEK